MVAIIGDPGVGPRSRRFINYQLTSKRALRPYANLSALGQVAEGLFRRVQRPSSRWPRSPRLVTGGVPAHHDQARFETPLNAAFALDIGWVPDGWRLLRLRHRDRRPTRSLGDLWGLHRKLLSQSAAYGRPRWGRRLLSVLLYTHPDAAWAVSVKRGRAGDQSPPVCISGALRFDEPARLLDHRVAREVQTTTSGLTR